MNVMKKILNALNFANVNNLGELRTLLRQVDAAPASAKSQTQHAISGAASGPAGIEHAHGAF